MTDATARTTGPAPASSTSSGADPTLGAIVNDLTTQVPELIRSELRLAQAELAEKGKQVGTGIGMFGAAGVVALYGAGALVATAILALALVLPAPVAGLIVAVALFVVAGVLALTGRGKVAAGTPLKPVRAQDGLKEDIATVKGAR